MGVLAGTVAFEARPAAGDDSVQLEQALLELADQGLDLVFTNRLVRPEMRSARPTATADPRAALDDLLRPHGLAVRKGPEGLLIVVRAPKLPSQIVGQVRERGTALPLSGVEVRLAGSDRRVITGDDGSFRFDRLTAGRHRFEAASAGFLPESIRIKSRPGETARADLELRPVPVSVDRIDVRADRPGWLAENPSTLELGRSDLIEIPRLGEDALRPMTQLPGTTGNDVSARIHVRGGRADEVAVRIDGLEVLEPFHLQDFGGALGILSSQAIDSAELKTGGFGAQFGDRMSGVLDLTTRSAVGPRQIQLGASLYHAEAGGSGPLPRDRGNWLASLRAGTFQPAARVANEGDDPRFEDGFAKFDFASRPNQSLRANFLFSNDRLGFTEQTAQLADEDEPEDADSDDEVAPAQPPAGAGDRLQFRTRYVNAYAWLNHQAMLGSRLFMESRASFTSTKRRRAGDESAVGSGFTLFDDRQVKMFKLSQEWGARIGERHDLRWGLEGRALEVDFDYLSDLTLVDPLAAIRTQAAVGANRFDQQFEGQQYSAFVTDRFRPSARWTVELGLRWDKNTILEDQELSPRFSLAFEPRRGSRLSLAWGLFHQSQRLYELQVEDGEHRFFPSEQAEHRILGFEQTFGDRLGSRRPIHLRLELYEHRIRDPRPRFENLFDPLSLVPELEADRIMIAPQSSLSRGFEVFVSGGLGASTDWWISYARARITDRLGDRDVPRNIDQTDTFKYGITYRTPWKWDLHLAGETRTGWPTTAITAVAAEDEIVPSLGPLNAERLPTYHRLDLRASRAWKLRKGRLELYVDLQNLTDERNVRGYDVALGEVSGMPTVVIGEKTWSRLTPSLGFRWSF